MNSINNTLQGLASSLFLNVGLTSVAEKLDPMQHQGGNSLATMASAEPCAPCVMVCNFAPEAGQ
jgi:hypothetical protein